MTAHVSDAKKQEVHELAALIEQYPVVAIVNLENLPARQLQTMRDKLRETVVIRMSKARLIKLAIAQSKKPNIHELNTHLKGMPAVLLSKESPFKLFETLKKNKSKAPIKNGQKAPHDIVIPAGPTTFAPGPIIGDLGSLKIKTGVENGKVAIKADSVVAKEGDIVSQKLAEILLRLGIEPMEIGLELLAAYENGEILTKSVLDIDREAYLANLVAAHVDALKLALEIKYPTKETMPLLIQKAFMDAKALILEQSILVPEFIDTILAKAESQAVALQSKITT